ncbi:MAG: hypothetical protein FJX66_10560 [Alphaproteobacteria bacterium]|nr:hypothetical protein [Alphaproteobacteria bacterium]
MQETPAISVPRRARNGEAVLARAALLRLVAIGFGYPVPGGAAGVRVALAQLDGARARGAVEAPLDAAIEAVKRAWLEADDDGLRREYVRLFHGNGPVSLRETAYGDGCRPAGRPVELADLSGFCLAFGLEPSGANPEMLDHVSVEAEFLSLMLLKDVYAQTGHRQSQRRIAREAARRFIEDHLGRWAPALRLRLAEEQAAAPYQGLGVLLADLVAAECRRLGAKPRPVRGPAPADDMQSECFVCPLAGPPAQPGSPDGTNHPQSVR